jgi:hypothetical protein
VSSPTSIVRRYLGLKSEFAGQPVQLLSLFWEPEDHQQFPLFAEHRAELAAFAGRVADPDLSFGWMTYSKPWNDWALLTEPPWLEGHVAALRRRYALPLGDAVRANTE